MHTEASKKNVTLKLALLDLWHEWILSLCMVLAIAAVLSPLMILLGLKHGTIQTMKDRLIEDPVNREITPSRTLQLSEAWFKALRQRDDIDFVIPTILRGSSIVRVAKLGSKNTEVFDLLPTSQGDPLILENNGVIPKDNECVLSYPAAEKLTIKKGDALNAYITRTRQGIREKVKTEMQVVAVLEPRADALPRVYAPLKFVTDVESYREGQAVPSRNWPGGHPRPYLSFNGILVVKFDKPLSSLEMRKLAINTGIADVKEISADQFSRKAGFDPPKDATFYDLITIGGSLQANNIKQVKNKLRGKSALLLPWSSHQIETEITGTKAPLNVIGVSLDSSDTEKLGIPELPWDGLDANASYKKMTQILALTEHALGEGEIIKATSPTKEETVSYPLVVKGNSFSKFAVIPAELAGVLETGKARRIKYDEKQGGFLLTKAGFRGFRLFAKSIDDVPALYRYFISQKIDVITKVQEIEKIKVLDRGLTRIFWLVAVVGIVGGIASLIASLYAAVERKKRDISVLRLMGISREEVFRFPIYQGISMAVMSVIVAIIGYLSLASVINMVFAADLKMGQKICSLPLLHFILAFLATTATAIFSSLLAAWKTTRIDPAEAIREE